MSAFRHALIRQRVKGFTGSRRATSEVGTGKVFAPI
jgi:hypothetical protein